MKWNENKLNGIWRLLSRNLLVKHTQWKFTKKKKKMKKKVLEKLNKKKIILQAERLCYKKRIEALVVKFFEGLYSKSIFALEK